MLRSMLVMLLATASAVAADPPGIWESPLPAQPFDKTPFRPVRIPDWLQETLGCGYTLSAMDSAARTRAAAHGTTLSEMGFVDPFYAYYDSKLLKRRSPHVPPERLAKDLAEYRKLGVRVLGVYPPTLQGEVYELHPDWRRIPTNTTEIPQIDMKKYPHGGMLCLLGPYGDFFIEVLAEIATMHPQVAAFSFDGLHHGGVCYCQHCRDNYRKETGAEIPPMDLEKPEFRRYQHWADRRLEGVVSRLQTRLKGIRPDLALVTWSTNAGRYGHFLSVPRNMSARMNLLFDAPDQEFWLDESNRGLTIVPAFANAYAWSVTNHRVAFSEPYLMSHGNPYGRDSFPGEEVLRRMLLAATYGAAPSIAVAQPPRNQADIYRAMDELQRRKPWLIRKTPEPWAAMLMSDNTKTFYGRSSGRVEERYLASVFGSFRAATEEHLPVTVINDWNLTEADLAKFRVLWLPNAASLDESQIRAIDKFVRDGGGVVASLDTSLFDEYGTPRANYALGELLGIDYRGIPTSTPGPMEIDVNFAKAIGPDYWDKRKGVFDLKINPGTPLEDEKLTKYVGADPVTFKGPAVRVAPKAGSQTWAVYRSREPNSPEMPAIVARNHGKGRVVFLAAGLDAAYYLYSYPYQRIILRKAVQWAANQAPPVQVTGPMCLHTTVMRQTPPTGDRLVVHLLNDLNSTGGHALPNDDVPLREETVPLSQVKVRFRPDYAIRRVRQEPEGIDLPMQKTASGTEVIVPRVEIHTMIVAEMEKK